MDYAAYSELPHTLARHRVRGSQYGATELAAFAPELNLELAAWSKIWEITATVKQRGKSVIIGFQCFAILT